MNKTTWHGNRGIHQSDAGAISFEILASTDQQSIEEDKATFENLFKYGDYFALEDYTVATNGESNNLPGEARDLIRNNPYLPEILKKQIRFMYGEGPMLYITEYDDKGKRIRKPVDKEYPEVFEWLDSWERNGVGNSHIEYFKKTIQSYYYGEDYYSGIHQNKSRRINGELPIRGLESLSPVKCRKALKGKLNPEDTLKDSMLNYIIVGIWDKLFRKSFDVYPRFNPTNPLAHGYSINYTAEHGFDENIYAISTFFLGLREWIKGANLNPKYINSYLKNSLNAKLHVIIPDAWLASKQKTLEAICASNKDAEQADDPLQTEYDGLTGIGSRFDYSMLQKLVDIKLQQVAKVLSGAGENQGKTFWSRSFRTQNGIEEWQFKEIPIKYKEFVESLIKFDERAISVITTAIGLHPSISNIDNKGLFGGSGSQSYYNYLIYLNSLPYAEETICKEINLVLQLNFPKLKKNKVKLGFYRHIPERIEDTPPSDRLETVTANK